MIETIIDFLAQQKLTVVSSSAGVIRTKHAIGEREVEIIGILGDEFPLCLPSYFLASRGSFGLLAHVSWPTTKEIVHNVEGQRVNIPDLGLICNGSSDALALNFHQPEQVYYAGLGRALDTITPAISDQSINRSECLREFCGHWKCVVHESTFPVVLVGDSKELVSELDCKGKKIGSKRNTKIIARVRGDESVSSEYWPSSLTKNLQQKEIGKGLFLNVGNVPLPPGPNDSLPDWWSELLAGLPKADQQQLREKARHTRSRSFVLICKGVADDQDVWFSICATKEKKDRAPISGDFLDGWKLTPACVEPHVREYLIPRGGGTRKLQAKKVIVVGCGSVGAIIADSMASAGVGSIELIDPDSFNLDNLYRHPLSMHWDWTYKHEALAAEMKLKYPFLKVTGSLDKLLGIDLSRIKEADLIIVAIGNSTHEVAFNEKLVASGVSTPVVYTWLEPNGIGGHAVLVGGDYSAGCHRCNFIEPDGDGRLRLTSNLNFLEPDQSVTKHLGSCGSLFLPYSQVDAAQTACLASKLAIRALTDGAFLGKKVSWRGPLESAEYQGLKFRHRFYRFQSQLAELPVKDQLCALCSP